MQRLKTLLVLGAFAALTGCDRDLPTSPSAAEMPPPAATTSSGTLLASTNFSGYSTGTQPSDWTERWATSYSGWTVRSNTSGSFSGNALLEHRTSAAKRRAFSWGKLGTPSDIRLHTRVRLSSTTGGGLAGLVVAGSGSSGAESGYLWRFKNNSSAPSRVELGKYVQGSFKALGHYSLSFKTGVLYNLVLEKSGTTLRGKVWPSGTSEPSSWQVQVTDASLPSGWVGLTNYDSGTFEYDFLHAYTPSAPALQSAPSAGECASPKSGWIWCDDFEQDRLRSYFEHNSHGGDFVRASAVGVGGSAGMRMRWREAGQVIGGWLHLGFGRTPNPYMRPVDSGTRNYREIYWRFYLKNQSGWTGGGGHKISRARIYATSDWKSAMVAPVWSDFYSPGNKFLVIKPVSFTDTQGTRTGIARWLGNKLGTVPIFDADHVGRWYCIEARVRLNDAGQSNGLFELWLNGVPEASRTGLNWVGSYSAYGINNIMLDNYWNDGAPRAQERYFDNFVVSTQRIGC